MTARNAIGILLIALPVAPVVGFALAGMVRELGWRTASTVWAAAILATASIASGAYLI